MGHRIERKEGLLPMYDLLLAPMKIGSMTVKNRTVMTAAE